MDSVNHSKQPVVGDSEFLMKTNRAVISPAYDNVVRQTLAVQVILGCLASFMLDGGIMACVVGVAIIGFWLCVSFLIYRRPMKPTKLDLAFVHWGFWLVLAVATIRQTLA